MIHDHLKEKWGTDFKERWQEYVPKHLLPRLYGFELMMAPYAMTHLAIALKLLNLGYKVQANDRAQLYLTNTLSEPYRSLFGNGFYGGDSGGRRTKC